MSEMYDTGSHAVTLMADAFARGKPGRLTRAQMNTVAFALRAMSPDKSWIAGFAACAWLMNGRYDDYARSRDEMLAGMEG